MRILWALSNAMVFLQRSATSPGRLMAPWVIGRVSRVRCVQVSSVTAETGAHRPQERSAFAETMVRLAAIRAFQKSTAVATWAVWDLFWTRKAISLAAVASAWRRYEDRR